MTPLQKENLVAFGATSDVPRAIRFFGETLGLRLVVDDPFALVFDANGTELRLQKVSAVTPPPYTVLGWRVRDLAAVIDALTAQGVTMERFPGMPQDERGVWRAPSGSSLAWFRDPDGNLLSLADTPAG
jgi:catechol 2,3-dioxygenase-like lactoylglutathione lyase family enzyme